MSVLSSPKLGASKRFFVIVWMVALVLQAASPARAQCPTAAWLPGMGVPGTNGDVHAITTWDPDGAGPATPVVVIGGAFTMAGNVSANNIAMFDSATGAWSSPGSGVNGAVWSLTTLSTGELVAGGSFTAAGTVSASRIARWNGAVWTALGAGVGSTFGAVLALTRLPSGHLVAGGYFDRAGGTFVANIARWNGTSWSAMGSGLGAPTTYSNSVDALLALPNGEVIAGGYFGYSGGYWSPMYNVARWTGTSWTAMGSGLLYPIHALVRFPNGDIAAAGGESSSPTQPPPAYVMRWNGTSWTSLGTLDFGYATALAFLPNGDLVAGARNALRSWNGINWMDFGLPAQSDFHTSYVWALNVLPSGDLLAGGRFARVNGIGASNVALRSAGTWSAMTPGTNAGVLTLSSGVDGAMVAGGAFSIINGTSASAIVVGDGSDWSSLGAGVGGNHGLVYATTTTAGGDVIVGGSFSTAGGVPAMNIARWDGNNWNALGTGLGSNAAYVRALLSLPNGQLIAGGDFYSSGGNVATTGAVAEWNGTYWAPLGGSYLGYVLGGVNALATDPNGRVYAGGAFTTASGMSANRIAYWNGSNWSALGSGLNATARALCVMPNGDIIAGGDFTTAGGGSANHIARWNGLAWASLGSGVDGNVNALAVHPNGDVIAGGSFTTAGGMPANRIARWNGETWSALGSGMDGAVWALTALPNGDLFVGGSFLFANGNPSAFLAKFDISDWPSISQHPHGANTCALGSVEFGVAGTGPEPLSFQWQLRGLAPPFDWINISNGPISSSGFPIGNAAGTNTPMLIIVEAVDLHIDIDAKFRCVVSNACGSAVSEAAPMNVWPNGTGDGDGNGMLDGRDITSFINFLAGGGSSADYCAIDMDSSGVIDFADLPQFIAVLLIGS